VKNLIREKRLHAALTQEDLAETCKVSRQTVISLENGKYEPTTRLALKLSKALRCKVEDLFKLEEGD